MTKAEAHELLNQQKDGHCLSLALTNQALRLTGDISESSCKSLCANGNEQRFNRPCTTHGAPTGERVGWSRYLDFQQN